MCLGIQFRSGRRTLESCFDEGRTSLPVLLKSGRLRMEFWGRGRGELAVHLPYGGWAPLPSIYAYKWKPYHPRPALIPAVALHTGNDEDGDAGWFPLAEGMAIKGLAATGRDDNLRIYVVTERQPIELPPVKGRWPRVVHLYQKNGIQEEG